MDTLAYNNPTPAPRRSSTRARRVSKPSSLERLAQLNEKVMHGRARGDALECINKYALRLGRAQGAVIALYDLTGLLVHVAAPN